jgi:hypothetical protein
VTAAIPAASTSAAQKAAPRSCGGRAGQIHGVVQCAASADSVASQQAMGPVQPNAPPSAAADSKPVPVIPARLRSMARVPRDPAASL